MINQDQQLWKKCTRMRQKDAFELNKWITFEQNELPRSRSEKYLLERNKEHLQAYEGKKAHKYYYKKLKNGNGIDIKASLCWTCDKNFASEFEGYMFSVQEQEISTKYLINKRYGDGSNIPKCENKCRICKDAADDVQHIICNCLNSNKHQTQQT